MKTKHTCILWTSWWRCTGNMQNDVFWKARLSMALRTGWACLMAGVILTVGSTYVQWITFPIFGYVMAVTVVGESTAAKAIQDARAIATGTLQGVGTSLVVLQLLPPSRGCFSHISVAITCISISAFFTTLPKGTLTPNHVLHKRIALAQTAIIYITALLQQENMDCIFFPLRLAGTTIVGSCCGMFALLIPFPRLAMFQVRSQLELSAQITSKRFRVLVDAFSAAYTPLVSAHMLQAKALDKIASSLHSDIKSIKEDVGWEAKHFPCLAGSDHLQQLVQGLVHLQKSLVGLELATKTELGSLSGQKEQRILLCQTMRHAFVYVTDWVCLAMKYASTDSRRSSPASCAHWQVVVEEGNEVLLSFHEALFHAREQVGYTLCSLKGLELDNSLMNTIDTFQGNADTRNEKSHDDADHMYAYSSHQSDVDNGSDYSCSDSEMVETICNAAREQLEYRINTASDVGREDGTVAVLDEVLTNERFLLQQHGCHANTSVINHVREFRCEGLQLLSRLPAPALKGEPPPSFGEQAAAFFFLFNVQRLVQGTMHILESSKKKVSLEHLEHPKLVLPVKVVASASDAQSVRSQPVTSQNKRLVSDPSCLHFYSASDVNTQAALGEEYQCPRQDHPVQKLCRVCSAESSYAMSKAKNQTDRPNYILVSLKALKPYPQQVRTAFKMSLAMAIGALLGFWFSNGKGYWADITLALGFTGASKGGSFKVALLRTLGTVSGSVYGLMVVLSTFNFPVLRLIALIPWLIFTSFLRKSEIFGYAGAVSALTGAIVILARTNKDSTDQDFTLIRVVEAFLGMAAFVVVEMLVLPQRRVSMVKPDISFGLGKLQEFVANIFELFSDEPCDLCQGSKALHELKHKEKKLLKLISCQNQLVKEASQEPQLWSAPFPEKIFCKVMEEQGHLMEMLHFCVTVLEDIRCVADKAKVSMDKSVLQAPLKAAMSIIEEKVVPTLGFLGRVLACEAQELIPMQKSSVSKLEAIPSKSSNVYDQGCKPFGEHLESLTTSESIFELNLNAGAQAEGGHFMQAFKKGATHMAWELQASIIRSSASCDSQTGSHAANCTYEQRRMANSLSLSLGTLAFAMTGLLHHTTQLEKVVYELLQEENPWTLLDVWDTSRSAFRHLM